MADLTFTQTVGSDATFPVQLNGLDGNPAKGLLASDALLAKVWAGQDQAVLFNPAATWLSPGAGTVNFGIAGAQTAALQPGFYRVQIWVTRGAQSECGWDGWLHLTRAPGSASPPSFYGTADGVREHLPYGDRYEPPGGLAAFQRELGRARKWVDAIILASAPTASYTTLGGGYQGVLNWAWGQGLLGRNPTYKAYLDANDLVQTDDLLEAVHRYAAHLVIKGTVGTKPDDALKAKSNELLVEAETWLSRCIAEIDTNGDGFGDIFIPLGTSNTRRA